MEEDTATAEDEEEDIVAVAVAVSEEEGDLEGAGDGGDFTTPISSRTTDRNKTTRIPKSSRRHPKRRDISRTWLPISRNR